jgi:YhhN-like protein.
MRRNLPALFFVMAALLNWAGQYLGNDALASAVKPALMPLLAASVLVFALNRRLDGRKLALLVSAELFGFAGDTLLLSNDFPLFAGGIGAFLIGHLCYMGIFGGESWKKMPWAGWLMGLLVVAGSVFGLVKLLRVSGELLPPMAVYGFVLMMLVFSTFCGLVRRKNKGTWALLFVGSLLFAFSDCLIAAGNFGVIDFALQGFVIMVTYVIAQVLLAVGALRLARK